MAQSLGREMEMSLDGDIEYLSRSGGAAGESVLSIQGSGQVEVTIETAANDITYSHNVQVAVNGPEVISGFKTYTDDIHVTRIRGHGSLEHSYFAEITNFPTINIQTEDTISGELQRRIDMRNNGLSIYEYLNFTGSGWLLDKINFSPVEE
jgi:hypothetical protein